MTSKKQNIVNIFRVVCVMNLMAIQSQGFAQVYGQNGMVVSSNAVASKVGVDILRVIGSATIYSQ